jgi:hypothetical protein
MSNTNLSSLVALSSTLAQSGKSQELLDCVQNTLDAFMYELSDVETAENISIMFSNLRILLFQERDVINFEKHLNMQLGLCLHHISSSQITEDALIFHAFFVRLLHIAEFPAEWVNSATSNLIWLYRKCNLEATPMTEVEMSAAFVAQADVLRMLPQRRGVESREIHLATDITVILSVLRGDDMLTTLSMKDYAAFHENAAKTLNYLMQFYLQIGFEDAAISLSDDIYYHFNKSVTVDSIISYAQALDNKLIYYKMHGGTSSDGYLATYLNIEKIEKTFPGCMNYVRDPQNNKDWLVAMQNRL